MNNACSVATVPLSESVQMLEKRAEELLGRLRLLSDGIGGAIPESPVEPMPTSGIQGQIDRIHITFGCIEQNVTRMESITGFFKNAQPTLSPVKRSY